MFEVTFEPWGRPQQAVVKYDNLHAALHAVDPSRGIARISTYVGSSWTTLSLSHHQTRGWHIEIIQGHRRAARSQAQSREQALLKAILAMGLDQPVTPELLLPIAKHWQVGLPHSEIDSYLEERNKVRLHRNRIMASIEGLTQPLPA